MSGHTKKGVNGSTNAILLEKEARLSKALSILTDWEEMEMTSQDAWNKLKELTKKPLKVTKNELNSILSYWWEQIIRHSLKSSDPDDYKQMASTIKRGLQSLSHHEILAVIDYFFANFPLNGTVSLRNALSNFWVNKWREDKEMYL